MAIPTIAAAGAFSDATTGSLTVTLPAHQADDILVVFHETNVSTGASTPSGGWAHIPGSPRAQGSNVVAASVLWKRAASSSETNPVFSGSANHQIAFAVAVRGCVTTGDPWDFTPVDSGASGSTSVSATGGTTTVTNTRTFVAVADSADTLVDQFTSVSNGTLTSFAVIDQEFTDLGNGGGVGVWSGTRATTGSTGTTTATIPTASWAALVFALVGASATTQSLSGTIAAVSDTTGAPALLADVSGVVAATSGTSGAPTALLAGLAGTVTAVSGLTGDIGTSSGPQLWPLTGTIAATSAVTGSPAARLGFTGTVAASSSVSGSIAARLGLAGVVGAVSTASGTIAARLGLTGSVDAVSTAAGNLAAALGLSGVIEAISNLIGDIGGGHDVPLRDITISAALDTSRISATLDPPRLTTSLDPARIGARMETT